MDKKKRRPDNQPIAPTAALHVTDGVTFKSDKSLPYAQVSRHVLANLSAARVTVAKPRQNIALDLNRPITRLRNPKHAHASRGCDLRQVGIVLISKLPLSACAMKFRTPLRSAQERTTFLRDLTLRWRWRGSGRSVQRQRNSKSAAFVGRRTKGKVSHR